MNTARPLLLAAAGAFRDDDPDPETRAEVDSLIAAAQSGDAQAWSELEERFAAELTFGTAGLRGLIGAGYNRMNRRVVARTTAALCAYVARVVPDAQRRGLCLGFDGRHQSRAFAEEVAEIAWGAGFVVYAFEDVVPTPLVAFSVLDRAAAGGIVITASHNPAKYNGYKVYFEDGAQLGSPHDRKIETEREGLGPVASLPRRSRKEARAAGLAPALDGVADRYVARVVAAVGRDGSAPLPLRAAYTALHGVGEALARRVFAAIGAIDVRSVAEQAAPDPDFRTVAFPNPEEKGALDRVLALGEQLAADLAIANDPDADRLAVAARAVAPGLGAHTDSDPTRPLASASTPGPRAAGSAPAETRATPHDPSAARVGARPRVGQLAALSGNELGILFADHLLARAPRDGKNVVVSTIVSTPLLEHVAREHGARCVRTLTGFKWIVSRALELGRDQSLRCVLGFEEALGYCIGDIVRDKDGISAAAHALHMAELHARAGHTLHDALEAIYRRHGLCESSQVSFTRAGTDGLAEIRGAMAKLRAAPPRALAEIPVVATIDLLREAEARAGAPALSAKPTTPPAPITDSHAPTDSALLDVSSLPSSDVIVLMLEGAHRITVRPSGTEPKLKVYLDVWTRLENEELNQARVRARALAAQLSAATAELLGF
jgi:phosphomannomutase